MSSGSVSVLATFEPGNLPHLTAGSACRGLGAPLASGDPVDDYDGEPRPQPDGGAPDLGADEIP